MNESCAVPAQLPDLIRAATEVLTDAEVPSPRHDAQRLAEYVLGVDRLNLILPPPVPASFIGQYAAVIERRRRREPLQHITAETTFRYLQLGMSPGVFVPRPETEVVAQEAIDAAAALPSARVVDLCTGAGGIALSVATEVRTSQVWAVDMAVEAVALTRRNAERATASIRVLEGDVRDPGLLADLAGTIDVLVSNPPYIPPDAEPVDPEVRDYDPSLALYGGGEDGLTIPAAVIAAAARLLRPGGTLVMEHAHGQGNGTRLLAAGCEAFTDIRTRLDLNGLDRMLTARRR